jgi:hypothetical protein
MRFPPTVYHVEVLRGRIVSNGIRIDGDLDLTERLVAVTVVDFDRRGVSLDYEEFLEIAAVKNGVRRFRFLDGVNEFVRRGVENENLVVLLSREEQAVPIDVGREMVEITILESGKRDGVRELLRRSLLSFGGDPEQKH